MPSSAADYVVVGGGLTGTVLASRLSQSPNAPHVVLIEAGPDPSGHAASTTAAGFLSGLSLLGTDLDHAYRSEPEPNTSGRVHTLPAGRALGGGTVINYGGWLRADAADYDDWAAAVGGDERWSYRGFTPWFHKAETVHYAEEAVDDEDVHGREGPVQVYSVSAVEGGERKYPLREPVKAAWTELGVPLNLKRKNGSITGLAEMGENSIRGNRQPANAAYPLDKVEVVTNTVVNKVLFSGNKATGVEFTDGTKLTARKEVILAAGTYRTPQVLMLSGIGPSALLSRLGIDLVHDSPHVGQNLHDHFAVYFAFKLRDRSAGYALGSASWQNPALFKFLPWDWVVSERLPTDIISRHESDPEKQKRNHYEVITVYAPPGIPGIPVDGTHIATSTMLLRPTSRGEVSIRSNKPNDPPRIKPNYFSTALDRDTLVHAARRTLQALLTSGPLESIVESETPPSGEGLDGLTPLTADASDEALEERIRRTGAQHHHSGGTVAMGKVVDGEGRVFGVERLRIVDASIITIPLGGHPQATLYPMAEQLATFIIRDA